MKINEAENFKRLCHKNKESDMPCKHISECLPSSYSPWTLVFEFVVVVISQFNTDQSFSLQQFISPSYIKVIRNVVIAHSLL